MRNCRFVAVVALFLLAMSFAPITAHAFSTGQNAERVIGQWNFTSNADTTSQNGMTLPEGVAFDSSGNLWVADTGNSRVLEFEAPFVNAEGASVVIGQPNFTGFVDAINQSVLAVPTAIAFDSSGDMWVVDQFDSRVLEFTPPFTDGEAASVVIGQPNFTSRIEPGPTDTATRTGLYQPSDLKFDSSGDLWVADTLDSRVLEFTPPFTDGEAASLVIGQSNFTTGSVETSQGGLLEPTGLAFDSSGNLWVSDGGNDRVLEFLKGTGFTDGEAASVVIGQSNSTSPMFSITETATQQRLAYPISLSFDSSGNLWVDDSLDGRIVAFAPPFSNDESASLVIGQPDFTTGGPSYSSQTSQSDLHFPHGIAFDSSGDLWVADSINNRVVEFATGATTTSTSATTTATTATTAPTTVTQTVTTTVPVTATTTSTTTQTATITLPTTTTQTVTATTTVPLTATTTTTVTATLADTQTVTAPGTTSTVTSTQTATRIAVSTATATPSPVPTWAYAPMAVLLVAGLAGGYALKRQPAAKAQD